MNQHLDISPEVKAALEAGKPVVALESTIISHGMPYPKNVETALLVEQTIRSNGATPAARRSNTSAKPEEASPKPAAVICPRWSRERPTAQPLSPPP